MILEIKDLTVEVEGKIILKNFNLSLEYGSIHAIMGPNGAGKSTLSRVIMGDSNYHVLHGDILFMGESILKKMVDERSRMGIFLAMQSPIEIEGVTNQDFLRTAMGQKSQKRIGLYDFMKQVDSGVEELKMNSELVHRSLNVGFSGGEKKKNEVLQIKLLKPKFIILDELDSGLDVDSLRIVCENILKYKRENRDVAIMIITHYSMILEHLVPDFVHVLSGGVITRTGDFHMIEDIIENGFSKYIGTNEFLEDEVYE